jgi:hypothetical protein
MIQDFGRTGRILPYNPDESSKHARANVYGRRSVENLFQGLRYALRKLHKSPGLL